MNTLIKNATIINEGREFIGSIIIKNDIIESILESVPNDENNYNIINAEGKLAIPGVIDDQVHFREPGLTHKGEIHTESMAAAAGGVTSFMEMPNTNPQTINQDALQQKFDLAAEKSFANYSFYIGATNSNLDEIKKTDPKKVCGIKVFMGASTGNMLVDDNKTLQGIFAEAPCLVTTHCEDEQTIRRNLAIFTENHGDNILPEHHPLIRSTEACYISSARAVELATKYGTQLHVLHLSTAKEMGLFIAGPVKNKKITGEVCVHHLWFADSDYLKLGHRIKWNPAIKTKEDRTALRKALIEDRLDVVATDHAPHLITEKLNSYLNSASGGPLVQHSLLAMLGLSDKGIFTRAKIVEKMCHAPAELYKINKRGFLREGYFADIVLIDPESYYTVSENNILYKCKWSPFEGTTFNNTITHTFINGQLVYENGVIHGAPAGRRLTFNR